MVARRSPYPVVDLFAGPGGLGEGFSAIHDELDQPLFRCVTSIECDEFSHQTLLLRHFLRLFPHGEFPDEYYSYLSGGIPIDELYRKYRPEYIDATQSALRISLGPDAHQQVKKIINKRLATKKKWVLVGGPPCQAYSLVGRSRMMGKPGFEKDARHFLYQEYLKIIIDHQPPVFVMENVKGLLSATISGEPAIRRIVSDLSMPKAAVGKNGNGLQYKLYSLSVPDTPSVDVDPRMFLVKAEDYGVPQARHRIFIVGIRSDLNVRPKQLKRHNPPSVEDTIGNLPRIRSGLSKGGDDPERWRKEISELNINQLRTQLNGAPYSKDVMSEIRYQLNNLADSPDVRSSSAYPKRTRKRHNVLRSLVDDRLTVLTGHESRGHMPSDIRRYFFASTYAKTTGRSPKLSDFPLALLPDHKNVELGCSGKMFSDRFRVQLPDQVSTTITSHISKDGHYFIHYDPTQCRSLTVREAARLQTFPDNYFFEGPRTSKYHQIGNAVPPYLAGQIAEVIAEVLDSVKGDD